jgi:hypothetical protein
MNPTAEIMAPQQEQGQKRKRQPTTVISKILIVLNDLLKQATKLKLQNIELNNKLAFNDLLTSEEQDLLCELPYWQADTLQEFKDMLVKEQDALSEKFSEFSPMQRAFVPTLTKYLRDSFSEAQGLQPLQAIQNPTNTITSYIHAHGTTASVSATPLDQASTTEGGLSKLLSLNSSETLTTNVKSSILVQTDDSYTTYTAPLPSYTHYVELNVYPMRMYQMTPAQNRWKTATKRVKVAPTPNEMSIINGLLNQWADRLSASQQLNVTSNQKSSKGTFFSM